MNRTNGTKLISMDKKEFKKKSQMEWSPAPLLGELAKGYLLARGCHLANGILTFDDVSVLDNAEQEQKFLAIYRSTKKHNITSFVFIQKILGLRKVQRRDYCGTMNGNLGKNQHHKTFGWKWALKHLITLE